MSLATFTGSVEQFFVDLWKVLKPDVQEAEQVAIAFFSAAAKEAANQLGTFGLKIVTDAVTAAETTGGSGSEKLAAAQAKIGADLATAGVTAATNIVNAAIEGAVAQLNSAKATAAANPTEPPASTPVADSTAPAPAA